MTIVTPNGNLKDIGGLSNQEKNNAMNFIRQEVHDWCDKYPGKQFAARDLFGGNNYANWTGTPLQAVYQNRHKQQSPTLTTAAKARKAKKQAGRDVGWLLKRTLHNDPRKFQQYKKRVKHYCRL